MTDYMLPPDLEERLLSPALVIWLDVVRANLRRMEELLGGDMDRWRPHLKTTKLPAVWAELLDTGVRHFKCATTREAALLAELLAERGGGDLLLAYPLVGPNLARLAAVARARPSVRVSVLVEDVAGVRAAPAELGLFVDVNPGMDRTGVPGDADDVVLAVAQAAGDRFRGLHHYEGHLYDPDQEARRRACFAGYDRLVARLDALRAQGTPAAEVVTSGTPGFAHALAYAPFAAPESAGGARHRVSPGTVVFHDQRSQDENEALGLAPAATVFARVVSHPAAGRVTCDAGSKSIAAEAGDPCARVLGHPQLTALTPSEEHLPLAVAGDARPPRGTGLLLVPTHVCPTVNLAERAVLVEPDGSWRAAEVSARSHELLLDAD
jgi:D-serine deaminase-like pyridoxal phosphate-dependent protein